MRMPGLRPLLAALLLSALHTFVAGCDRQSPSTPTSRPSSSSPAVPRKHPSEVDRLQALPYASYAPELDQDAPDGVTVHRPERVCPGYTLVIFHHLSQADLLDLSGRVVHRWRLRPSRVWANGRITPTGDFIVVGADPADAPAHQIPAASRYLLKLTWRGDVVFKRRLPAHHDVGPAPDNRLVTLVFHERLAPQIDPDVPVRDDQLMLLSADGRPLETISLLDLLLPETSRFPLRRVPANRFAGTPMIDLFHCNSVEWMDDPDLAGRDALYSLDNVLVCSRHQNRIFVINWPQRRLVWSWGADHLRGPHDATVLDNGHILVFDNGVGLERSRVLEVDPLTARIVWQYQAPRPSDFYTLSRGSNQRLPNGNTLITDSDHGWVFEITPTGDIVWEYRSIYHNRRGQRATIVRAYRYTPAFIDSLMQHHSSTAD